MSGVAVLFARQDSHYKSIAGVDVWDIDRDARKWPGGMPVVAHPPCRNGKTGCGASGSFHTSRLAPLVLRSPLHSLEHP